MTKLQKKSPPDKHSLEVDGLEMTSPSVKEVWMVVEKKKKTPTIPQPVVTTSQSQNQI
jgi:hypothetical protein